MISEFLNQPAVTPLFNPAIIGLLIAFAVLLGYAAWTDYRKGILLPNWKYWLAPAAICAGIVIARTAFPETFGAAAPVDLIIAVIVIIMYYITAWQGVMGGADFWGCSLCTIALCTGLGWPAFLVFVFIALIFIPFVCRTAARLKWCHDKDVGFTWADWKQSNRAVKKSYRLLPAVWAGYVGALLVYIGAWFI